MPLYLMRGKVRKSSSSLCDYLAAEVNQEQILLQIEIQPATGCQYLLRLNIISANYVLSCKHLNHQVTFGYCILYNLAVLHKVPSTLIAPFSTILMQFSSDL